MTANLRRSLLPLLLLLLLGLGLASFAQAAALADSAILFIGDGMGPVQLRLAREAAGGQPLTIERMHYSGRVATVSANSRVTDSAAAGTALATGHKTNNGMIAVAPDGEPLTTILEHCQRAHKSTGIISTDALHGATPASFAAHAASRGDRSEIALQLARSRVPVMLAFWDDWFLPESAGGSRTDGEDLLAELRRSGYRVVSTKEELAAAKEQRLFGTFDDGPSAPTLADMVTAALDRLSVNADGFFLIIEGARIDWKCHDNDPAGAVLDVWELDQAVAVALDYARTHDRTTVVVTADHETGGLSIENPDRPACLGAVKLPSEDIAGKLDADRTNISDVLAEYAGAHDLTPSELAGIKDATDPGAAIAALLSKRAGIAWSTTGHTSTPVRVFAFGPGAERFSGGLDNTAIPKRLAAILGLTPFPP